MCSTVNAADAVYCVQCGARVQLLADADLPPMRSAYDDDYASDTNWFDETPASEAPPPAPTGGGLGWLAGLRGGGDQEDSSPPPATPEPPTSGGPGPARDDDAPAAPAPPPPAAPAPRTGGGSWLDSLRDASVAETPEEAESPAPEEETVLPSWLQGTTPPAPPATTPPAWLNDTLPAPADSADSEPPPARLPAWLADEPPEPGTPPSAPAPELPAWLAGLRAPVDEEEEAAEPPAPEPEPPPVALPPWLSDLGPAEAAPPPAPPAAEVPPWLQDVALPADLETAPPPAPAAPRASVPPWLAGQTDETETPLTPRSEQPENLAWAAGQPEPAEPPAPEPPAPNVNLTDEIELPAWLQAAAAAPPLVPMPTAGWGQAAEPPEPALPAAPEPEPVGDGSAAPQMVAAEATAAGDELVLPDWMEEPAAAEAPAEPPVEVPASPPAAEEPEAAVAAEAPAPVPAEPLAPVAEGEAGAEPPVPAAPAPVPARPAGTGILFPAWLDELSTTPEAEAAPATESALVGEEDLPAWLRALQPEAPTAPAPAPVPPIAPAPAPVPGSEHLPEWLQALSVSTPVEEEAAEEAPASLAEALRAATPGRVVRARPPREGAVDTFARLLNPPEPVVAPKAVPTRRQQVMAWLFPDRLVYLILLLAVVAGWALLRTPVIAPNPALAAPNDEARAFHSLIAPAGIVTGSLGTGGLAAPLPQQPVTGTAVLSPALVVYDWDASRYGEMHELSRAVTRDLLSNNRPFTTVSLLAQGPGFADQVANEVGDDPEFHVDLLSLPQNGGQYGVRYVNLGWRTGNEAAIHSLASDANGVLNARGTELSYDYRYQHALSTYPLLQTAPALSQYGVVILLVSDENDLRVWLEQLTSQVRVPVIAAVPVSLRAGVAPYLDKALERLTPARLRGAIFGVQGASQLEQLRLGTRAVSSAEQIRQGRWLHTLSVALLVVAALLLLGFLTGIYRWSTRPRQ
jgi:hypothetical protein